MRAASVARSVPPPVASRRRDAARVVSSASASSSDVTTPASLVFVTGNRGKVERLNLALGLHCPPLADSCDVLVEGVDLSVPEIQADTVTEVATAKALAAFEILRRPLVVHDCGLVVRALNDWPGPYTKDANYKLGTSGLLALLAGVDDRTAGWDDTIVYVDAHGATRAFVPETRYTGVIADGPPRRFRRFEGPERAGGVRSKE